MVTDQIREKAFKGRQFLMNAIYKIKNPLLNNNNIIDILSYYYHWWCFLLFLGRYKQKM